MESKFLRLSLATPLILVGLALGPVLAPAQQTEKSPSAPSAWTSSRARASQQSRTAATESASPLTQAGISQGTKIDAVLESTLDAHKAKPGEEVTAKVTKNVKAHGKVVIRKGGQLVGRITNVQAGTTAKSASQIAVTFDRLVQGNTTSRLNAVVTSVLSTPHCEQVSSMDMREAEAPMRGSTMPAPSGSGGGGLVGGVAGTANSTVEAVGSVAGGATTTTLKSATSATGSAGAAVGNTVEASTNARLGNLSGASVATPVRAIHLSSETRADNNTGVNSVFSTRHGNLRLNSETRLQFKVAANSEASSPKN